MTQSLTKALFSKSCLLAVKCTPSTRTIPEQQRRGEWRGKVGPEISMNIYGCHLSKSLQWEKATTTYASRPLAYEYLNLLPGWSVKLFREGSLTPEEKCKFMSKELQNKKHESSRFAPLGGYFFSARDLQSLASFESLPCAVVSILEFYED